MENWNIKSKKLSIIKKPLIILMIIVISWCCTNCGSRGFWFELIWGEGRVNMYMMGYNKYPVRYHFLLNKLTSTSACRLGANLHLTSLFMCGYNGGSLGEKKTRKCTRIYLAVAGEHNIKCQRNWKSKRVQRPPGGYCQNVGRPDHCCPRYHWRCSLHHQTYSLTLSKSK